MDMFGYVVMGLTTTVSTTMQRNVFIMTTTRENCTRFCSRIGGDTFIKPLLICGQQLQTAFEHLVDQSSLHGQPLHSDIVDTLHTADGSQFPVEEYLCRSKGWQLSHTRTGLAEEGRGILLSEHSLQNMSPQFRQWCCESNIIDLISNRIQDILQFCIHPCIKLYKFSLDLHIYM